MCAVSSMPPCLNPSSTTSKRPVGLGATALRRNACCCIQQPTVCAGNRSSKKPQPNQLPPQRSSLHRESCSNTCAACAAEFIAGKGCCPNPLGRNIPSQIVVAAT